MAALQVKFTLANTHRRMSFVAEDVPSWEALKATLSERFGLAAGATESDAVLVDAGGETAASSTARSASVEPEHEHETKAAATGAPATVIVALSYVDEDGDTVVFSSDVELRETWGGVSKFEIVCEQAGTAKVDVLELVKKALEEDPGRAGAFVEVIRGTVGHHGRHHHRGGFGGHRHFCPPGPHPHHHHGHHGHAGPKHHRGGHWRKKDKESDSESVSSDTSKEGETGPHRSRCERRHHRPSPCGPPADAEPQTEGTSAEQGGHRRRRGPGRHGHGHGHDGPGLAHFGFGFGGHRGHHHGPGNMHTPPPPPPPPFAGAAGPDAAGPHGFGFAINYPPFAPGAAPHFPGHHQHGFFGGGRGRPGFGGRGGFGGGRGVHRHHGQRARGDVEQMEAEWVFEFSGSETE